MRCWRRSPIKRGRKHGRLSSNGAHGTVCAPQRARSQRWLFCGHVYRAEQRLRRSREDGGLPMKAGLANEAAGDVRYAYKASLIGAAHQFALTEAGLAWRIGGKSGIWPYADIAAIRLSYRAVSMQSRRFRADIEAASRQRLAILSTSWQTVALMAPQDHDYRAFITQLHRGIEKAGSKVALIGGVKPGVYAAGIALLVLVAIAISGLFVRAIATGEWAGGLFLVGFAALFAWQIGGLVLRNRARAYTSAPFPAALLR